MIGENSRHKIPSSRSRVLSRLGVFDLAWASVCPMLAFLIRDGSIYRIDTVITYSCVALIASVITFEWFRISVPISTYFSVHDAAKVAQACFIIAAVTAVVLFTFTRLDDAPRSIPVLHFFVLAGGLFAARTIPRLARNRDLGNHQSDTDKRVENVLIVEASRLAWFFSQMVEELASNDTRILAILDERPWLYNRSLNGFPIIGPPSHLDKIIEEYGTHGVEIHKVVIAAQSDGTTEMSWSELRRTCEARNIKIEWLHERFSFLSSNIVEPFQTYEVKNDCASVDAGWSYWKLKRFLDIIFASFAMIVITPLAILVAAFVLMDVGTPIVFWQQRLGRYGGALHVYKFRTMKAAFDRDGDPIPSSERLSVLGRLLRKNHFDEIPQLFNILTGGMSLIGPRPLLPIDQPRSVRFRLQVRPGLTGLAQVNGAKLLSPDEKNALDEWYIRHASFLLDIQILVRTIWVIINGEQRNETTILRALSEKDIKNVI